MLSIIWQDAKKMELGQRRITKKQQSGIKRQQSKEMPVHRMIWDGVMKREKGLSRMIFWQQSGAGKQQIKGKLRLSIILPFIMSVESV